MKNKSPCFNCKDRYPGCQSNCKKGIDYSKQLKAKKETIKAERMFTNYKIERIINTKEKAGIK